MTRAWPHGLFDSKRGSQMRLGKGSVALVVALVLSVVLAVLLSPLGFERRPPADLTLIGYVSIGAVVVGILVEVAAIVLIFRRVRRASILAIVGSVAFLVPNVTDKIGVFFSLPAPLVINALEDVHLVVLLVALVLAWSVYRGSESGPLSRRGA
jgi:amino acid transporter